MFTINLVDTRGITNRDPVPYKLFVIPDNYPSMNTDIFLLINGHTGVTIFFVLSGFLITSILLSEKVRNLHINFKIFYFRRFLRLLPPLIIFFTAVYTLMSTGHIWHTSEALLYSFFY